MKYQKTWRSINAERTPTSWLGLPILILGFSLLATILFWPTQKTNTPICVDGDTFALRDTETKNLTYYRLSFINTPEKNEQGYDEASEFTCSSLKNYDFKIITHGLDFYGRTLAEVILFMPENETADLGTSLIGSCLAEPYYKSTNDTIVKLYQKNCLNINL